MIQHSVPQQISAFQFKLFGNLTIREFAFVGTGFLFSFLIFISPMPFLLKLPLILFLGGGGAALGLLPIQGRPFDQFIILFIKAIASPTQRIWRKEEELPYFLQPAILTSGPTLTPFTLTESRLRLEDYLKKIPTSEPSSFDAAEQMFLDRLDFESALPSNIAISMAKPQVFIPTVKEEVVLPISSKASKAVQKEEAVMPALSNQQIAKPQIKTAPKAEVRLASEVNFVAEQVFAIPSPDAQIQLQPGVGQIRIRRLGSQMPVSDEINIPIKREKRIEINADTFQTNVLSEDKKEVPFKPQMPLPSQSKTMPTQSPINIKTIVQPPDKQSDQKPQPVLKDPDLDLKKPAEIPTQVQKPEIAKTPTPKKEDNIRTTEKTLPKLEEKQSTKGARSIFSIFDQKAKKQDSNATPGGFKTANIPAITHIPNVLNGIILDSSGAILENAIILVKNESQTPVRALKTNKLGQFVISTPLPNGKYTIEAEKEGFNFDIIEFQTKGNVMQPIEVRAK